MCADKFAQDRIVDQLATALFDEDKSQHQHTPVAARLNDAASEPLTEAQDNLAERLRVGDWLQFKSLDTPLNLIWIGDQPPCTCSPTIAASRSSTSSARICCNRWKTARHNGPRIWNCR